MRQNPHVRICGGPGSATTLVYPTASMTSRGWSVSSAQSRNDERQACGTQSMPHRSSSRRSLTSSRRPVRAGNTSWPSPSARAASRTSSARPLSNSNDSLTTGFSRDARAVARVAATYWGFRSKHLANG